MNGPVVAVLLNVAPIGGDEGQDFHGNAANGVVELVPNEDGFETNEACGVPVNNAASLYEAILQRRIYLNVHSDANPPGETRGQLFPINPNDEKY